MSKSCTVSINEEKFVAKRGDVLLDAALVNGIDIPHDCRSGHCGTCQVRVIDGLALGGESGCDGMVRACQARLLTDLEIMIEPVPDAVSTRGVITGLRPLAPDVMEVRIHLAKPVTYLPGQYYKFRFLGYPARCYSPTAPMHASNDKDVIRLHVRRIPDGRVSSALGTDINKGHPVKLKGPFGTAYLRPAEHGRLILVSSGTGFAPIWSIAKAALQENPQRPMALILGAKEVDALYMGPAARMLAGLRNVAIVPVVDKLPDGTSKAIRKGRPTDHMPVLRSDDIVYACGAPPMVDAVRVKAMAAGAMFYADPFLPQSDETDESFLSRVFDGFGHLMLATGLLGGPAGQLRLGKPAGRQQAA